MADREIERVVVIGAGPSGLSAAAMVRAAGIDPLVLDRASEVGSTWKAHYDRLHLHTVRWLSHLPGLKLPRHEGRWVSRDGVVNYLKEYAHFHQLRIRSSTAVKRVSREGKFWHIETSGDPVLAEAVVVATGYNREPVLPEWPGMDGFAGELMHSSRYKNGKTYAGRDVLVVGAGNSGAEIAVDLVESEARTVWISVRTGPNILRRDLGGMPSQALGIVLRKLPPRFVDAFAAGAQKVTVGDLARYGMPPPERGMMTRILGEERVPILDVGLIGLLKKGKVEVVPAVEGFDGSDVLLKGDKHIRPHAVIAATGFRRGLEDMVGHLDVLDAKGNPKVRGPVTHPSAPNLYFTGYTNPISGLLREVAIDAKRIARAITTSGPKVAENV